MMVTATATLLMNVSSRTNFGSWRVLIESLTERSGIMQWQNYLSVPNENAGTRVLEYALHYRGSAQLPLSMLFVCVFFLFCFSNVQNFKTKASQPYHARSVVGLVRFEPRPWRSVSCCVISEAILGAACMTSTPHKAESGN